MSKQTYSKAKGRDAETGVAAYLQSRGIKAERRRLTGCEDCGDISGWSGVTVEVKAEKKMDLAGAMDELEAERLNASKRFKEPGLAALVVQKRRGVTNPGQWYAVMTLQDAVRLIELARKMEAIHALNELKEALA